jgi:6-phosphogluconolactonase
LIIFSKIRVGPDGHTCSLFPNHRLYLKAHQINDVVVSISDSPKLPPKRVTLSLNCINNSTNLIFLCGIGSNPATLRNILIEKNIDLPAAGIKSNVNNGIVKWFLDKEAAALL